MPPQILSAGIGVQSSTLFMMGVLGEVKIDLALFADTGWEPQAVYRQLEWLQSHAWPHSKIPLIVVRKGSLKSDEMSATTHIGRMGKYTHLPFQLLKPNGKKGKNRRTCTDRYKIEPIQKWLRHHGASSEKPVDLLLGISWDESERVRDSRVSYARNVYPLVERHMTRQDCLNWMASHGFPKPPKSACVVCPFKRDAAWRSLRHHSPEEFQHAVDFDRLARTHYTALQGVPFLHDSCKPLGEVPLGEWSPEDDEAAQADECGLLCARDGSL